ncbi:FAD:protein FMN transferase [Pleionea sp. CnH1-48]|uniref:FAD:protein FMN transferase n=1 Tax=Pleionea sp. CnH1-48 TaxID=2954494 RepID=UPI002097D50B|nr:FAD:protein FMN transferase [Pleionea sp. CnH1-48]MCO7226346.1 FAD:protein FMN transferase [Pleionea sp. CnH1-48]
MQLFVQEPCFKAVFQAMGGPCELLIETDSEALAFQLASIAQQEVERIEAKYSRYKKNNICHDLNQSNGKAVAIDAETYRLLKFADDCYQMSEGLFDMTSGVLRKAWKFDGSNTLPDQEKIKSLLPHIGWQKITFDHNHFVMPPNMELDFGGIGKEYAVDNVCHLLKSTAPTTAILVNLGGDLATTTTRHLNKAWRIGIEGHNDISHLEFMQGAIATSGNTHRFFEKEGVRYSHILNPKTGMPITNAPSTITVAAPLCIEAGLLATLAILHGSEAKLFLDTQNIRYWIS